MIDVKKYTLDTTLEHIVLLEEHLKDIPDDPDFCFECTQKHLLTLSGLANEGLGFFDGDNVWVKIRETANSIRNKIETGKKISPVEISNQLRDLRKELNARYKNITGWECEGGVCHQKKEEGGFISG